MLNVFLLAYTSELNFKILFCLTEKYAEKEEDQKAHLLEFVRTINRNIQPFHMEIKKGVSEEEGKSFYCLVSIGILIQKIYTKLKFFNL